ncbi:MAG TPA: prepilin-type N-terminal cleavage/methylation domain-containing protein [Polyangiaceae bacterium]
MPKARSRSTGFTLVELMITVAIVGVLAVIAVVSYNSIVRRSHTSEATQMVSTIKVAQEAYHAEVGTYLSISGNLDSDYCPAHATGQPTLVQWDPACGTGAGGPWRRLPVSSSGPVLFGYATVAGLAGQTMPMPGGMKSTPAPPTMTGDWYVATAKGDMNGDATNYTIVVGTSLARDLYVDRDGE